MSMLGLPAIQPGRTKPSIQLACPPKALMEGIDCLTWSPATHWVVSQANHLCRSMDDLSVWNNSTLHQPHANRVNWLSLRGNKTHSPSALFCQPAPAFSGRCRAAASKILKCWAQHLCQRALHAVGAPSHSRGAHALRIGPSPVST